MVQQPKHDEYPTNVELSWLSHSSVILHSLFHCGLEIGLCFGQFVLQTPGLVSTVLHLLLQFLQICNCLLVSIILLMVENTILVLRSQRRCTHAA